MSLFVCDKCRAIENTALAGFGASKARLCSECSTGTWHGRWPKRMATAEELRRRKEEFLPSDGLDQVLKGEAPP